MCPETRLTTVLSHRQCAELLPWLVNATLERGERDAVESHLETCDSCRRELGDLRELAGAVREGRAGEPLHGALEPVRSRIDRRRRPVSRASAPLRWLVVAQAAAIVALLAGLLWTAPGSDREYRTLSDPPAAAAGGGERILVAFDPAAREADIRRSLEAVGAQIVAGPNRAGAYVLRLEAGSVSGPDGADALARLRLDPLIRLAQPLADAPSP